jgi:hypothetical protein
MRGRRITQRRLSITDRKIHSPRQSAAPRACEHLKTEKPRHFVSLAGSAKWSRLSRKSKTVSYEALSVSPPNQDRKTVIAFWFLPVFAVELFAVVALAVLR